MNARLRPNTVAEIRHRHRDGWTAQELAGEYRRSMSHIYRILSFRSWKREIPYQHPLPLEER